MKSIDLFLKALEKTYKERKITFVPRWHNVRDDKFPAFTKFNLEVVEIVEGKINMRFNVQRIENLSLTTYIPKEEIKKNAEDTLTQQMIEMILKYYMYGELVQ